MASFKEKLKSSMKSGKVNVFLLFLMVSFIILVLSKLSKDYTKAVSFNLKAINLPEERIILEDSTQKINILLKTYGFKLLRYYISNPSLTIDFSKAKDLDGSYLWTIANNGPEIKMQFADNVEIEKFLSDSLVFRYDVNFVKKVPVKLVSDVNFAPGYNLKEEFVVEPDSIRLIGPRAIIEEMTNVETDSLTMNDVKSNINATLNLVLPQQTETIALSSTMVNVIGLVDKFTEGRVEVPVSIKNIPPGASINYFPKKVYVVYNTALSNYNEVNTDQFIVECDYSKLTDKKSFLVPELVSVPDHVKNAKINQAKIEFIISQ